MASLDQPPGTRSGQESDDRLSPPPSQFAEGPTIRQVVYASQTNELLVLLRHMEPPCCGRCRQLVVGRDRNPPEARRGRQVSQMIRAVARKSCRRLTESVGAFSRAQPDRTAWRGLQPRRPPAGTPGLHPPRVRRQTLQAPSAESPGSGQFQAGCSAASRARCWSGGSPAHLAAGSRVVGRRWAVPGGLSGSASHLNSSTHNAQVRPQTF